MPMPSVRSLRRHSLKALAAVSLITALQAPVYADLDTVVKSLPADSIGALTVDVRPETWSFLLKHPELREWFAGSEFQEISENIKTELGLEPMELLQSVGSHAVLAAYQNPDKQDSSYFVVSLELKNTLFPDSVIKMIKKKQADGDDSAGRIETYKNTEIAFTENESGEQVVMAYHGKTLLFSNHLGHLRQALDLEPNSTGLMANPRFKPVYDNLGKEPIMAWIDLEGIKFLDQARDGLLSEIGLSGVSSQALGFGSSVGFGMSLNEQGLAIKNVMGFKKNGLTGSQQAFLARLTAKPGVSLESLLAMTPEKPLFTGATGTFHLTLDNPVISGEHREGDAKELEEAMKEGLKEFKSMTGLDFKQDLVAASDGRIAVSAFYLERFPSYDKMPHIVMMMGVKDSKSFLANLQQKLKLIEGSDPSAKPLRLSREPIESYRDIPLYRFEGNPEVSAALREELGGIEPAVAVIDNVFLIGTSRDSLRAVVDHSLKTRTNLLDDPDFKAARSQMNGKDEQNLFYADLTRWYRLADHFLHGEAEFKAWRQLLSQFKFIAGDGSVSTDESRGHLIVNADLNKVDFAKLTADIKASETVAKVKAVEVNMSNLHSMLTYYSAQHQGKLPKNAAQLLQHADDNGYSSLLENPFGIEAKPALQSTVLDYHVWKSYKPTPALAGVVVMEIVGGKQPLVKLYGTNEKGELIQHQAQDYVLEFKPGK